MRPLTLEELIEGIAVELGETPHYNPKRRLNDIDSIQEVCPGLTEVYVDSYTEDITIRIAHFSVREYLESDEIQYSKYAAAFSVRRDHSNLQMACISLTILVEPSCWARIESHNEKLTRHSRDARPVYAAMYWAAHYFATGDNSQAHGQVLRFFTDAGSSFEKWVRLMSPWLYWRERGLEGAHTSFCYAGREVVSPLYHASRYGFDFVVQHLLDDERAWSDNQHDLGLALEVASINGHESIVRILLDSSIQAPREHHEAALWKASRGGYVKVVQLLIDKSVNVNADSGKALYCASAKGHLGVVELLVANQADVNIHDRERAPPLTVASGEGHTKIIQVLLDNGADIHAKEDGAVLAAAALGSRETVQLLLDHGADIHRKMGGPIYVASKLGHKDVVQLLIDHGADISPNCGEPLRQAAENGHGDVVQLLIDYGADVNRQGPFPTPLQLAAAYGHVEVVRLLIKNNADVNALQNASFGSALQAASFHGRDNIVELLLASNADVDIGGGCYGSAIQAAAIKGHKSTVQLLLRHDANLPSEGIRMGALSPEDAAWACPRTGLCRARYTAWKQT
jgi:ankyrin repeat protein